MRLDSTQIRRLALLIVSVFVLVYALVWFSTHSFVEITVKDGNGETTFNLENQDKASKTITVKSTKATVKKLVKKGTYLAEASQGNKSYLVLINSGGWLGTTKVSGSLTVEKGRQFVGDNPGPCLSLTGEVLISNDCGGMYENLKTHIPASASTPTQVLRDAESIVGSIEGMIHTSKGTYVLIHQPVSEDDTMMHILYRLNPNSTNPVSHEETRRLTMLNPDSSYSVSSSGDSFVVYSQDFKDTYTFTSIDSDATKVDFGSPKQPDLTPRFLGASDQGIATVSNNFNADNKKTLKNPVSEIAVYKDGKVSRYKLEKAYTNAFLCGHNQLCVVASNELDIYDIKSDKELTISHKVQNVKSIVSSGDNKVVLGIESGIMQLDLGNMSGFYLYKLGDYKLNSIEKVGDNYLLNISHDSNKYALLIDTKSASDEIDKEFLALKKTSEVQSLSAYKNLIFVTPNLGTPTYNSSTGFFGFSTELRAKTNEKIKESVGKSGIDTKTYTVINTLP